MDKVLSIIGIVLVAIGTIWSLWSVLVTNSEFVGTAKWYDNQGQSFKKQKRQIIIGIILIVGGSILQIIGIII